MVDSHSDRSHSVTFDLNNLDREPQTTKTTDAKDMPTIVNSAVAPRTERICKLLAVFIVIIAFVVHLVRILNSGEGYSH